MTYGRALLPRFYMDNVNWLASRGKSRNAMIGINSGAGFDDLNSGFTKYQLFDMNPNNFVTFDTDTGTDTVSITIDFGTNTPSDSITFMNHNINSAGGRIRIAHDTSAITTENGGNTAPLTEVLNGTVAGNIATPAADGETILKFTSSSERYWAIEIYDVSTWTDDLQIGNIVLGEYYTMTVHPDMPTNRDTSMSGVSVRESAGGEFFGSASWLSANDGVGTYSPFRSDTYFKRVAGREAYDLSYSYIADTSVYPSDRADSTGSSNFLADVVNKAGMSLIPFVWVPDSTSSTEGDYLYARFDQNSFSTSSPSANVENFSARIVQEF